MGARVDVSKCRVAPKAGGGKVGGEPVVHGIRLYALNPNIRSAAKRVLAVRRTTYAAIVVRATAAAIDDDRLAEVGAHRFKYCESVRVHRIKAATAVACELRAAEVGANLVRHKGSSASRRGKLVAGDGFEPSGIRVMSPARRHFSMPAINGKAPPETGRALNENAPAQSQGAEFDSGIILVQNAAERKLCGLGACD